MFFPLQIYSLETIKKSLFSIVKFWNKELLSLNAEYQLSPVGNGTIRMDSYAAK